MGPRWLFIAIPAANPGSTTIGREPQRSKGDAA